MISIGIYANTRLAGVGELRPVLQQRYAAELATLPEQNRVSQLTKWGAKAPAVSQTQRSLGKLWGISQGPVSTAVAYLVAKGYVLALPRVGANPIQYTLSGASRLIFG